MMFTPHPNLTGAPGFHLWERNPDGTYSPHGFCASLASAITDAQASLRHRRVHMRIGRRGDSPPSPAMPDKRCPDCKSRLIGGGPGILKCTACGYAECG